MGIRGGVECGWGGNAGSCARVGSRGKGRDKSLRFARDVGASLRSGWGILGGVRSGFYRGEHEMVLDG